MTGIFGPLRCGSREGSEHRPAKGWVPALAAVLTLAACSGTGTSIPTGDALAVGFSQRMGLKAFHVGDKFGYLDITLHSTSNRPITLSSITFPGARGVLRTLQVEIGLIGAGVPGLAGGRYETNPPVDKSPHGCAVETLRPVKGFRLAPHGHARIWVVFKAINTGRYKIRKHVVTYTQDGVKYQQVLPQGYEGVVTRNGTHLIPSSFERPCLSLTTPLR